MLRRRILIISGAMLVLGVVLLVMHKMDNPSIKNGTNRFGGPYFYESFSTYHIPFRPVNEISQSEAVSRPAYCVAYFDNSGKIVSFEKYLKGEQVFIDKYFYDADGFLKRREGKNRDGELKVHYYEKGKLKR